MDESADPVQIGHRLRRTRRRRGLTQEAVAKRAGISRPYLALLESGHRRFDRRGLLAALASALSCSTVDLTGEPRPPADPSGAAALSLVPAITAALYGCDLDDAPAQATRPVAELVAAAHRANRLRDAARYGAAAAGLAALLTELHVVAAHGRDGERRQALRGLALACYVVFSLTRNLGHPELAGEAARRCYRAARRLEEPAYLAFAAWQYGTALERLGAHRRVRALFERTVDEVAAQADPTAEDTSTAQAYGMVHLAAGLHQARTGGTGADHLAEATALAARTGEGGFLRLHWGPTNVALWRLATEAEAGDGPAAAERFRRSGVDAGALGSPERLGAHHLDQALAWGQAGGSRDGDAVRSLRVAEQVAPTRTRHDPRARELLDDLLARAPRTSAELTCLRARFQYPTERDQL
ncbi:helix-turn-helix domain-containing protein [Actinoalloteichus spitiensis]|uniref:helix-turn-helix domain-containing protein n=1 Tax=Actinoalloteichus spitiensis TaxID=252394 RepID=UPI0012F67118|nr:helix-turn-helix domain-containing protein [Actinoalloteichus spitiensis]